ncbi:MAG: WD40/YVTN/BNR-like repeat-containing protein [Stellaceae bacterium]
MAGSTHVYAGVAATVGMEHSGKLGGIFRQSPGDAGWEHLTNGLPADAEVHAITVHPTDHDTIFVGSTKGIYRSNNHGGKFEHLPVPSGDPDIWSILVHPKDPRRLYAGATPVGVYRSDDGGDHWKKLADPHLPDRVIMAFACRVMRLDVDPNSPDDIYATLEANGTMRSRNAGESWHDCTADLIRFCEEPKYRSRIGSQTEIEGMLDGHALACSAAAPGTVFLANRMGLFKSADHGDTWQDMDIGRFSPLTYGRDIRTSPHDPKVMYAALSPAARSTDGSIYKSEDVGKTWTRFDHGVKADATMMGVTIHPRDANQVYGVSRVGQVFGTQDGGKTWHESRLPEGVRDAYCIACG